MNQKLSSHQILKMSVPRCWTSSNKNSEKQMSVVYKPLSIRYLCYRTLNELGQQKDLAPQRFFDTADVLFTS